EVALLGADRSCASDPGIAEPRHHDHIGKQGKRCSVLLRRLCAEIRRNDSRRLAELPEGAHVLLPDIAALRYGFLSNGLHDEHITRSHDRVEGPLNALEALDQYLPRRHAGVWLIHMLVVLCRLGEDRMTSPEYSVVHVVRVDIRAEVRLWVGIADVITLDERFER